MSATTGDMPDLGANVDPGSPNPEAVTPRVGSMDDHQSLLEQLKAADDEELRAIAVANGVDGASKMSRDELLAKLMDEPGANEI